MQDSEALVVFVIDSIASKHFLQLEDDPVDDLCDGQGQLSITEVESHVDTKCSDKEESRSQETGTIQPDTHLRAPTTDNSSLSSTEVDLEEDDSSSLSTESSTCSTPTLTDCLTDYESDATIYPDTDCEDIYGGPAGLKTGQICELSDLESEQEEVLSIDQNYYDVITE